jgi:hypothetical protein
MISRSVLWRVAVHAAALSQSVSALFGSVNEKIHSPSFPADAGWREGEWSVARALPLSTEVVGTDHWLVENGPSSVPGGWGRSEYTGKQLSLDRRYREYLQVERAAEMSPTDGHTSSAGVFTVRSCVLKP